MYFSCESPSLPTGQTTGLGVSPECNFQRLGAVVLGVDEQRVLQKPQGEIVLHHSMEDQANVVLGAEAMFQ